MLNTKTDVLMVIEGEIATTHLIERILMACKPFGINYRKQFLSALKIDDFHSNTIPLFVRCGDPSMQYWVNLLRRARCHYFYYIDDNFWQIKGDTPLACYYQHPIIRHSLEIAVTYASKVLANSAELALFLGRLNKNVNTLPSFFDFSLIDGCVRQSSHEIRIGFAGSPSRQIDLDIIRPIIFPILDLFPHAIFEFAGVMPQGLTEGGRIRFFPHTSDYIGFVKFLAERNWSIGLAPLVDNVANRCKTNNKYREYGACKIAGIYSNMPPYRNSVLPENTGLLVENSSKAWFDAVKRLCSNRSETHQICQRAYDDVRQKHCVERVSSQWAECLNTFDKNRTNVGPALRVAARTMSREKLRSKIDGLSLRILAAYDEGGLSLVLSKSISKMRRTMGL